MKIYFLTTILPNDKNWGSERSRCWGYFEKQEDAVESALKSADFYSECGYYTHIVIEELEPGWASYDLHPLWFEIRKLEEPIKIPYEDEEDPNAYYLKEFETTKCDAPEWAKSIVGWGIG